MMPLPLAEWAARLMIAYAVIGVVFAVPFVLVGVDRIDPNVRGSTRAFRIVIVPGVIALWPLLLGRWLRGHTTPEERNAHRDAAGAGR